MRNGFEMSEQKSHQTLNPRSLEQYTSQKDRLQSTHRPHIILKPLSDADWRAISNKRNNTQGSRSFGDMLEGEQRKTLKKLQ